MFRIDGPGHVGNRFTQGDPSIGQRATRVTSEWLNSMQEEVAFVIEESGIVLDKAQTNQLYAAIVALVSGVVGDGSGAVPTIRQVLTAGIASGGGDLAADRTITVEKASAAEVAAGVNDSKAVTPLALQGGTGASLMAGVGYKTIFGLIFAWGTFTVGGNSSANVVFPISFPTMCVHADVAVGVTAFNAQDNNPFVSGKSASAMTVFNAVDNTLSGTFFAIGF